MQMNSGLGGIANIFNQKTAFLESGPKHENRALKETPVPPEIYTILEELKAHTKAEKVKFAELYKAGESEIERVNEEADEVAIHVGNLSNTIYRHATAARELRNLFKREIAYGEMATQTKDTPSALQLGYTAPTVYFNNLITDFEIKLEVYRKEIAKAEGILTSCPPSKEISTEDLCAALDRLKEGLVKVAAKIQEVNEKVMAEMETHRNLQRYVTGETSELICPEPKENQHINDFLSSTQVPIEKSTILFPIRMMDYGKLTTTLSSPIGSSKTPYYATPPNIGSATVKPNPLLSNLASSRPIFSTTNYGHTSLYGSPSYLSPLSPPGDTTGLFGVNQNLSLKRTKH